MLGMKSAPPGTCRLMVPASIRAAKAGRWRDAAARACPAPMPSPTWRRGGRDRARRHGPGTFGRLRRLISQLIPRNAALPRNSTLGILEIAPARPPAMTKLVVDQDPDAPTTRQLHYCLVMNTTVRRDNVRALHRHLCGVHGDLATHQRGDTPLRVSEPIDSPAVTAASADGDRRRRGVVRSKCTVRSRQRESSTSITTSEGPVPPRRARVDDPRARAAI